MKKALLGTSAIALAAMAAPANAAEWDVRVGGYYNAMVAYADTNGNGVGTADFSGVDGLTQGLADLLDRIEDTDPVSIAAVLHGLVDRTGKRDLSDLRSLLIGCSNT